uniref:Uncharacterized protein n=1 Tax=viral metagenome TaxID=1070528 RepID=A0A6C0KMH7_9ZZZZ
MSVKNKSMIAIFIVLLIALSVKPKSVYNIYNTALGRLLFIGIIIFLAMNNITLALVVTLIVIISLNQFSPLTENMDNITIGDDNVTDTSGSKLQVLTKDATIQNNKISDLKAKALNNSPNTPLTTNNNEGVDKEDIKNAIQSVDSKSIQIDPKNMNSSENVKPHSTSMLSNDSNLTEGFCPCAAALF